MRNKESGMVIVEATIVFPIMFIIVFMMLFAGNIYLQKCRVDSYVNDIAIEGSAFCADPLLYDYVEDGKFTAVADSNVYPYRYFDSNGAADVKQDMQSRADSKVKGMSSGLFSGMKPKDPDIKVDYHNGFLYSTFSVTVKYKIVMPIRMLWENENISISLSSHANMPVSDTCELIRNTDMVWDYMERLGVADFVNEKKKEFTAMFDKAMSWFKK